NICFIQGGSYSNQASNAPPLPPNQFGDRFQQSAYSQDYGQQSRSRDYERQGKHPASGGRDSEPPEKRGRFENSGNSSALDLLKQEYEDDEPSQPPMAALMQVKEIKQEAQWPRGAAPFGIDPQQLNTQSLLGLPPGHLLAGQPVAFGGSNLQLISSAGLAGAAERAAVIPGYGQAFAHAAAAQPDLVKGLQEKRNLAEAAMRAEAANAFLAQQTAANQQAQLAETLKNWQNQNQQQGSSRPNSRGGYNDHQGRTRPHSNPSQGSGYGRSNPQYSLNPNQSARDQNRPSSADQRESYGQGKNNQSGNSGGRLNYGQDSNSNEYGGSDFDKSSLDSSQNNDKRRRERKRPSKWDNPDDSNSNAAAAAESGVSQEVMAKVQAIQQSIQRQHEQQESQATEGGPTGMPSEEGIKQEKWPEGQENNQFPGNFGGPPGPRMDAGGFPPQRGGFGGRPPRPMMGRGGPPGPGQRPPLPFRPPGPMGDRFPRPDGFPPRPDGFGGPRFGGRGPLPPDQRFGGPGRGGPPGPPPPGGPPGPPPPGGPPGPPPGPHFRPRGPPGDQGGMRGGRPPFGGRGPPPFGGRGGGMPMRPPLPRGGPPGGRWPRP
ncbi:basic salivary proline-rich protein 1-like, partial [Saccostrea cucullata]|uniref:basic salivary proline-rich protein 1-like n=1 Tax=Saccostrea cuccullata TaxID=36930 RepID=UPI002ED49293